MRCGKYGCDNREGRKFCAKCGGPLPPSCPKCGARNEPQEFFCGECGASLAPPQREPTTTVDSRGEQTAVQIGDARLSEDLEGERKTVTALLLTSKVRRS